MLSPLYNYRIITCTLKIDPKLKSHPGWIFHQDTKYGLMLKYMRSLIQERQNFLHFGWQFLSDMFFNNIKWKVGKLLCIKIESMNSGLDRFYWWDILNRFSWSLIFIRWLQTGTRLFTFNTATGFLNLSITATWFRLYIINSLIARRSHTPYRYWAQ